MVPAHPAPAAPRDMDTSLGRCRVMIDWRLWQLAHELRRLRAAEPGRREGHAREVRRLGGALRAVNDWERDLTTPAVTDNPRA